MHLKINPKPDLKDIKFSCDEPLHSKLDAYPLTRDFLNMYNTTALIGTQGSGKTTLMINLLLGPYKKVCHFIYVFIPKTSRNSLKNNVFDKYLPANQIYEELNEKTINEVYEKVKINSANGHKSMIIMDDVQKSLKDYDTLKSLKNITANQRHLKCVNIILLQNWFALDKSLRELINNVILFKLAKSQTQKVFNEVVETHKDKFEQVRRLVYDAPHNWLFVNIKTQRMFKCFDEIIADEEESEDEDMEMKK